MSVRDALLAILTLGPAYGLQLHGELRDRAPHRGPVNVGQIYSTLDRLGRHGLIAAAGTTPDGLPLYALTPDGSVAASVWMTWVDSELLPEWTGMLDQVLVTASIDGASAAMLIDGFERWWTEDVAATSATSPATGLAHAAQAARLAQGSAALVWLDEARGSLTAAERPLEITRPRRGRRPAA